MTFVYQMDTCVCIFVTTLVSISVEFSGPPGEPIAVPCCTQFQAAYESTTCT